MSDDTPNGASEPQATNTEGVSQETVSPASQETELANTTGEALSQDQFRKELHEERQTEAPKADPTAGQAHTSKMMIAQARAEKFARENSISKTEAIVDLLDEGKIKQDEANYLFKRLGESGTTSEQPQSVDTSRLKQEMRAEDKLFAAVESNNLDLPARKALIDEYKRLAANNSPSEAVEFALYRSGLTVKVAQDEAYKQAQAEGRTIPPLRGSSPSTPKKPSGNDQTLEEQEEQDKKAIQELQTLKQQQGF